MDQLQELLFFHPLYKWTDKNHDMNILAAGSTESAVRFIDLCLSVGQMNEQDLRITWYIDDDAVKKDYLSKRPGLGSFVNIDGEYGSRESKFPEENVPLAFLSFKILDDWNDICLRESEKPEIGRYIFIATSDDSQNPEIARKYKEFSDNKGINCLDAYVSQNKINLYFSPDGTGIAGNIDAEKHSLLSDELERMAFNAHRVWEGSGNVSLEKMRKRFNDPYYYDSSVSFVLSIPYKLNSKGIFDSNPFTAAENDDPAEAVNLYDAAGVLYEIIREAESAPGSEAAGKISILAMLEHRRWVMEKVTQGAVTLRNTEFPLCSRIRSVKWQDKNGILKHPCIVSSSYKSSLDNFDHDQWDDPLADLSDFDALDRMSVELHRELLLAAGDVRKGRADFLRDTFYKILGFKEETEKSSLKREFDRYFFCIKNIIDESFPYSSQFEIYEKKLADGISGEVFENKAKVFLKETRGKLFPVIESNLYRDYKKNDEHMVKQIPYILTAKIPVHICMPLETGPQNRYDFDDIDSCFMNVASATVLFADKIDYLLVCTKKTYPAVVEKRLKGIYNYFNSRGIRCTIRLAVFGIGKEISSNLGDALDRAKSNRYISQWDFFPCENDEMLRTQIVDYVRSGRADYFDGSCELMKSNFDNAAVINDIVYTLKKPYFEFDSYQKTFNNCCGCDHLQYMQISSYINIMDMFALSNAGKTTFKYPDYSDIYEDLWEIFCGTAANERELAKRGRCWAKIVDHLQDNIEDKKGKNKKEREMYKFNKITGECEDDIIQMLNKMKEHGFLNSYKISPDEDKIITCDFQHRKIREILKAAGKLLEIYVYFEACKTGYFDDVQSGYEFKWENEKVANELDCVLTKGYRSVIAECKCTSYIQADYFYTLDSLANRFGIGCKKVMIVVADTEEETNAFNSNKPRGDEMNILIISSITDLRNIGKKLVEIMEL